MTHKNFVLIVACIALAPFAAKAGSIQVNGTCEVGTCPLPTDSLGDTQSNSGTFDFDVTVGVHSDLYEVSGSYSASYTHAGGSTIQVNPTVTYMGGTTTSTTDTITFDYFQNYVDPIGSSWDGTYEESVPLFLSANAGPSSTVQGQLEYDGQTVGVVGPFGPGTYYVSNSKALSGLTAGNTLMADYNFVFTFDPGTVSGAGASSTTPEPSLAIPTGLGLLCFLYGARRRTLRRNS